MSNETPLSERYKGRTSSSLDSSWSITTVAKRGVTGPNAEPETCEQTGEEIPPGTKHLYVTAARKYDDYRSADYEHWCFVDEEALQAWLDDG